MFRRFRSRAAKLSIAQFELSRLSLNRGFMSFLGRRKIQPLPSTENSVRDVESGGLRQPADQQRAQANLPGGVGNGVEMISGEAGPFRILSRRAQRDEPEAVVEGNNGRRRQDSPEVLNQNEGQTRQPQQLQNDQDRPRGNENNDAETATGGLGQANAQQEVRIFSVPTYLQTHFEMMHFFGLSPVNGNGEMGPPEQRVLFVLILGLGLFDALGGWKNTIVDDEKPGELIHCITIGYLFGIVLLQLYGARLVTVDHGSTSRILRRKFADDDSLVLRKQPKRKISKESKAYFLIVVLMSLSGAIRVDWMIEGDTPSEMIRSRAVTVSEYLYHWEKVDSNGTNSREELKKQYGTEMSTTTVAMGALGIGSIFVNNMQDHLVRDILLMTALHTHRMTQIFHSTIQKTLEDTSDINEIIPKLREIHDKFAEMSDEIEFGFGTFFKVVHLQNWLFCSYFLFDVLIGDTHTIYFVLQGYIIPKIFLAYYIASMAFAVTQSARNTIEKFYERKVADPMEKVKIRLFLKTVKRHPIGNGRGQFLLDDSFLSGFVCVVISCFLLFADSVNKK